jgi:hypothetical protein
LAALYLRCQRLIVIAFAFYAKATAPGKEDDPPAFKGGTRPPGALAMDAACRQIWNCVFGDLFAIAFGEVDPPPAEWGGVGFFIMFFTFVIEI